MKYLIVRYGSGVAKLASSFEGIVEASINLKRQVLTLFCSEDVYRSFVVSLHDFKPPDVVEGNKEEVTECGVCFATHSSSNRLEYCGHVYCRECMVEQLKSTVVVFPVTCDTCENQLVWKDFQNLIAGKVIKLRDITSASLKRYIAMNLNVVHNCTTPDCDMVYFVTAEGKRFVCSQCGANICTCCHAGWHEGYDTCLAYRKDDVELEKWLSQNTKKCPKCNVPIEKNGGCRRVACTQCINCHICWLCLQYFETYGGCYDHLASKHNGIFD